MAQILCNCVPWCPLGQARTGAFAAFAVSPKIVHLLLHLYSIRNIHATTVFDKVRHGVPADHFQLTGLLWESALKNRESVVENKSQTLQFLRIS